MKTEMNLDSLITHLISMRDVVGNSPISVIAQTDNDQHPQKVAVRRVYMNNERNEVCILVK